MRTFEILESLATEKISNHLTLRNRIKIMDKIILPKISNFNLFGEEIIEEYGCDGCAKGTVHNHNGIYANIMDWDKNKKIKYIDLLGGMK